MCNLQTQDLNVLLAHGQFLNIPNLACLITSVVLFRRFSRCACFGGFVSVFRVLVHAMYDDKIQNHSQIKITFHGPVRSYRRTPSRNSRNSFMYFINFYFIIPGSQRL